MVKYVYGFTLIELLVVISILAILGVIGLVVYSNVQSSVQDARRKADINQIARAYEVNYSNGQYQALTGTSFSSGQIPIPPEGGSYFNEIGVGNSGFRVCLL